jgi:hypothetical protein
MQHIQRESYSPAKYIRYNVAYSVLDTTSNISWRPNVQQYDRDP